MRTRLRPAHDAATLAGLYAKPHRHDLWEDHIVRVDATIALARELFARTGTPRGIADLSCGDAAIVKALVADVIGGHAAGRVILGDIAPGYEFTGPIEQTLQQLTHVDLLICTETIEHLDDPDAVLALARDRAGSLLLSTPDGNPDPGNEEHYWAWDAAGVRDMLLKAGWSPVLSRTVTWHDPQGRPYRYQLWGCT